MTVKWIVVLTTNQKKEKLYRNSENVPLKQ